MIAPLLLCAALLAPATGRAQEAPAARAAVAGIVRGRVLFEGQRPARKLLPAAAEAAKGCCPDGRALDAADPSLLVAEDRGLSNVVLTIEVAGRKAAVPERPFVLDQRACVFEPHVLIATTGASVHVLNSDAVAHNVRAQPARNEGFNRTTAPGGKEVLVFEHADRILVRCDYHPWMSAWIFVTDTPFHALSGADGMFAIEGLPPGTHKVALWHETLGRGEAQAVVREDGSCAPLEIRMAERKKKV